MYAFIYYVYNLATSLSSLGKMSPSLEVIAIFIFNGMLGGNGGQQAG